MSIVFFLYLVVNTALRPFAVMHALLILAHFGPLGLLPCYTALLCLCLRFARYTCLNMFHALQGLQGYACVTLSALLAALKRPSAPSCAILRGFQPSTAQAPQLTQAPYMRTNLPLSVRLSAVSDPRNKF